MITVKQQAAPLQAAEIARIRRQSNEFDIIQHKYRESFHQNPMFKFDCLNPYEEVDKVRDPLE